MESQVNPALIGKNVEFRVREIKRYIVTKYERDVQNHPTRVAAASSVNGEYENFDTAYAVAYALAKTEHERLGYPIDDMRIQYPKRTVVEDENNQLDG